MRNELENAKDKVVGMIKETSGKLMDDDKLELKGKMQSMKADIGDKVEDMKDEVAGKANQIIDKVRKDRNNNCK